MAHGSGWNDESMVEEAVTIINDGCGLHRRLPHPPTSSSAAVQHTIQPRSF